MKSTGSGNRGIPAFTVLLLMAVMAFIGIMVIPTLDIRYTPETSGNRISVSFSWPGVSERIVESEATSKLEGALSGLRNCTEVYSSSNRGGGSVTLTFRKGTDMVPVRFEIASRIRNIYSSLPEGMSYPEISLGTRGTGSRAEMTYIFKSSLPSVEIEKFVNDHVLMRLSGIEGVENISINGTTPYEIEILFDAAAAENAGITAYDITSAYNNCFRTDTPGITYSESGISVIKLKGSPSDKIEDIPVKNIDGRTIYLRDIAEITYRESEPASYFRLNGLNTLTLSVGSSPGSNLITVASAVRKTMDSLSENFPEEISAELSYDSSEYISSELNKIAYRTLLCIAILLLFVFMAYRSFRYLAIIFTTLLVNILAAIVIYKITGLSIHIYTLAGITVSLGIIIDSSIVMTDHYSYYRNRSVFPALLGATATTIGALCIVMLLPEEEKKNLADFSKVIIINLSVSLVMAYAFIPSLVERFPVFNRSSRTEPRKARRIIRFNSIYSKYIEKGQRHKWVAAVVLVAGFGIPLCLLPQDVAQRVPEEERTFFQNLYNKIMGWRPYSENRDRIDRILGSSFALFDKAMDRGNFYREPGQQILYIQAGMPEGCTVAQLNTIMTDMENYLSKFSQIKSFSTRITSYDNAMIEVSFLPEYEKTPFPAELKSSVTTMASSLGGANWRVWGINDSDFNNNISTDYKSHRISLTGYNYDKLQEYAAILTDELSSNRRVSAPELMSREGGYGMNVAGNEFNVEYDFSTITARNIDPYNYFSALQSRLYDGKLGSRMYNDRYTPVVLRSSDIEAFDLWNITNTGLTVDSTRVKMSEIGTIQKKRTGMTINRRNQSYEITVGFDFIGSYNMARKVTEDALDKMNNEILPVGYKAESASLGFSDESKKQYASLILLVIAIIYVTCSMIFESLRMPFAVILMIPVSFIGVFLTFGLSDFVFDQGGFAAFVMLSGIVVNAGIYIVNEYINRRNARRRRGGNMEETQTADYIRSFNHKIYPILLTVISTVLGLVPFLFDGPSEVFWFAFAAGTTGGLLFSLLALLLYMPLFCFRLGKRK